MNITIVAGARPNFMKIAPIIEAIQNKKKEGFNINYRLVHTGQHYDKNLSGTFFEELNIPLPDSNLEVKSGTQAEQTAAIMIGFENELMVNKCDLVMVVGDVTSTMACTIVAKKAGIKVAHVEAGIRSGDMDMPEEINRIVTDSLTDYFFTTSTYANKNLSALGVPESKVFFVGNVMIDTLLKNKSRLAKPSLWDDLNLSEKKYMVMTLHRPSNVDEEQQLKKLITQIVTLGKDYPIIFPVHPRTKKLLSNLNLNFDNLYYVNPLGYLEFNYLVKNALAVITDSGGITEETTVMNVPCITLRDSTERPETCDIGTNILVGSDPEKIKNAFNILLSGTWKQGVTPQLWDGNTAKRIVHHLVSI
ncbi:UDP-N-acetylglucosamine 2-epimerase (non-hydrolyzing) [Algibacter amylolyticus]|uniref:UDP-N-acetylglucosamine 2-epimerase (Non-hydrolyzing) n=1 Tax=Algibacter amylolyticus TaxID=1608400 RepID=A0A5M7BDA6_9FLAO|nr:UDP-N-acetylglucosamine 2-epimerase (non-hydrolyzing) [Algibacter amylolyticus]KAA5827409.1 UDP-N-acetylglucosamine 2-epimerase (non-hydrolyzing) [Algibacter amylolyticus]MBB5266601.1 UDP-N-acetylglucosamine 2-epimerase (non-hydrolyzing) [Algibacter amylolyticus]TSJ81654.1 UDP-N-acetylglucosamine 2-epimerase (non-hydrolyzing) [Algibacter amylolyticus]